MAVVVVRKVERWETGLAGLGLARMAAMESSSSESELVRQRG